MSLIGNIRDLPRSAVFALYNPKKKKVYVTLARNFIKRLAAVTNELRDGSFKLDEMCQDYDDLELIVLETSNSMDTAETQKVFKLHMFYWQNYVEKLGLTHYGKKYTYVRYKPRLTHGINYSGIPVVFVNLISTRNDSFIVGVFENYFDGKNFSDEYLSKQQNDHGYIYPVYACNDTTKEFLKEDGKRLDNVFKVRD